MVMKRGIVLVAVPFLAWMASAQSPVEDEFLVNDGRVGDQRHPSAGADDKGRFLVLWQDQESNEILAMRYTQRAERRGQEIRVSPLTAEEHMSPAVAINRKGRFVGVWESTENAAAGPQWRVSAQPYKRNGRTQGQRRQVNASLDAQVSSPDVAINRKARFVVVWAEDQADGDGPGILARRFKKNGVPDGEAFQVNTYTVSEQDDPAVAMDDGGRFVVVWTSFGQDGDGYGIYGQRFRANGNPDGEEFRVSTRTRDQQHRPAVAMNGSGEHVVVWESQRQDGNRAGIFGQRFRANGRPLGTEFQVNSTTRSDQSAPAVSIDRAGNIAVIWSGWAQDGDKWGVFGQQYGPDGAPIGAEFQLNQSADEDQGGVISVAFGRTKEYVAAWMSEEQDGDGFGVVARRFDLELAEPPPASDPQLQFLVDWNPGSTGRNVNIHVREPNGEHIFFGNKVSATGGTFGEECRCSRDCHEETISWGEDSTPQAGAYEYWIQLADLCDGRTNDVTYRLQVWGNGELLRTTDTIVLSCDGMPVPDCFSAPLTFEYP